MKLLQGKKESHEIASMHEIASVITDLNLQKKKRKKFAEMKIAK